MKKLVLIIMLSFFTLAGCNNYNNNNSNVKTYNVNLDIKREGTFTGLFLSYSIYVDGEKLGEISNLQSKDYTIELSEGEHTLNIKRGIFGEKIKFIVDEDNTSFDFSCKAKSIGIDVWVDYSVD